MWPYQSKSGYGAKKVFNKNVLTFNNQNLQKLFFFSCNNCTLLSLHFCVPSIKSRHSDLHFKKAAQTLLQDVKNDFVSPLFMDKDTMTTGGAINCETIR